MIPVNRDGHRLDIYLNPPTADMWAAYTQRAKIHKLCNDFQLSGHCNNGLRCHFDHSPLDDDLKSVLKLIVHDYPCGRRGACRLRDCNLGHVCYREACRGSSGKGGCRLNRQMHGIDLNVAEWVPAIYSTNGWQAPSIAESDYQPSERGGAEIGAISPTDSNSGGSDSSNDVD